MTMMRAAIGIRSKGLSIPLAGLSTTTWRRRRRRRRKMTTGSAVAEGPPPAEEDLYREKTSLVWEGEESQTMPSNLAVP